MTIYIYLRPSNNSQTEYY